jgi:hypothetical protein
LKLGGSTFKAEDPSAIGIVKLHAGCTELATKSAMSLAVMLGCLLARVGVFSSLIASPALVSLLGKGSSLGTL